MALHTEGERHTHTHKKVRFDIIFAFVSSLHTRAKNLQGLSLCVTPLVTLDSHHTHVLDARGAWSRFDSPITLSRGIEKTWKKGIVKKLVVLSYHCILLSSLL